MVMTTFALSFKTTMQRCLALTQLPAKAQLMSVHQQRKNWFCFSLKTQEFSSSVVILTTINSSIVYTISVIPEGSEAEKSWFVLIVIVFLHVRIN